MPPITPALEKAFGYQGDNMNLPVQLAENGGDPAQDGCAFHVTNLQSLFAEFQANGLNKDAPAFTTEQHGGTAWKVFYVVAPDGLCYWFGERAAP